MTKILISNDPAALEAALSEYSTTVTVEAEYGDIVVRGSQETLAHHGPRSGNPAPCLRQNTQTHSGGFDRIPGPHTSVREPDAIGLSHVDLDALGGMLAVMGIKPKEHSFWELAAFVDVNGAHKLKEAPASLATEQNLARLHAWWAWNEDHKIYPPRDGSVKDITPEVASMTSILKSILAGDEELLAAGRKRQKEEDELNQKSFVYPVGCVLLRQAPGFVNHLYATPTGRPYPAVAALKEDTGEVIISLADPVDGVSCAEVMKAVFGPEAGGHAGIAGGPRTGGFTLEDAERAAKALAEAIQAAG